MVGGGPWPRLCPSQMGGKIHHLLSINFQICFRFGVLKVPEYVIIHSFVKSQHFAKIHTVRNVNPDLQWWLFDCYVS